MALLRIFASILLAFWILTPAHGEDRSAPNILFIIVDDLGWSDLACYGHPYHRTPNIDRLASQGLKFTNGYSPAPICSAARASILTGKTTARLGFEFVTKNEPGSQQLDMSVPLQTPPLTLNLPTQETTIAEYLKALGYSTAFFGKWHVSQHFKGKYLAWHPQYGPKAQGFDFAKEDFGDHPYSWKKGKAGTPKDLPPKQFPNDTMVNRAASHLRENLSAEHPLFAMVSSFYVHTPVKNRCRWLVDEYKDRIPADSPNRSKRLEYAAFVETLDHHVGTLLRAVEDSGQSDNTMVVFLSDNGGHPEFCSNAPLRGSKWNLYEGGVRVPFLVRWPNRIRSGLESNTPVIGYDLLPTFVRIAGGEASNIDGVDISPVFDGSSWKPDRSLLWHFPYYHPEKTYSKAIEEIGVADFAVSKTRPQSAIRRDQWKAIHFAENDRLELYDLNQDISEQHNIASQYPDITAAMRKELKSSLQSMNARRAILKSSP